MLSLDVHPRHHCGITSSDLPVWAQRSISYDGDLSGGLLHLKKVYKVVSILGYIKNLGGHSLRQPL